MSASRYSSRNKFYFLAWPLEPSTSLSEDFSVSNVAPSYSRYAEVDGTADRIGDIAGALFEKTC